MHYTTSMQMELTLAQAVRVIRAQAGLTQFELAEKSTVSLRSIAHLESGGDVRLSTLENVLGALGYELTPKKKDT